MKKFLALILAVLMIAGSAVSVAAFDDVSGKYAEAIDGLQATGIVAGTSETTFTPDALVTRWQMALFMARAASAITDDADWAEGAKIFADCTQYLGAIQYCFGRGIIKGVTTTEFAPNNNILFRDGIIMAIRALGYEKEDADFYNKTGAAYWTPYYEKAIELGLLENLGNVAVDKALTRAETAQLIYNMIYTPVYAKDGANTNNYTLYDVAFGGKAIVDVENAKTAWVVETPGYFFGEESTLADDAEEIVIAWNEDDNTIDTATVSFDDLAKWGVDVETVDELFGASLEIINYAVDKEGDADYSDFEYLANFVKAEADALTNEDVTITETKNKIGTKTYNAKKPVVLLALTKASDDLDAVEYAEIDFEDLEGEYDLVAYDVDGDNYYEYAFVNFADVATYDDPDTKGKETTNGAMKGLTDVVYSETLEEGDVFLYTFDMATKTVNVKGVVEELEGKVTAYSEKKNADGDTIGYITIDGAKYTIEAIPALNTVNPEALQTEAANNMGKTYKFSALDGKIVAFGEEIVETEEVKFLVLKDFTDFELYDYVVMEAYIDGELQEIKVNKIARLKEDKTLGEVKKLDTFGYSKLAEELKDLFGIYKYTVDADGYYKLTERNLDYNLGDFVDLTTADGNVIKFKDGIIVNGQTSTEVIPEGANKRNVMLRINAKTAIYQIDRVNAKVTPIQALPVGEVKIAVGENVTFYADKIGFGSNDVKPDSITWDFGVASVIYIESDTAEIPVDFDVSKHKLVLVQEEITTLELGTESGFGLSDEDEDPATDPAYTKYTFGESAYDLATFKNVDSVFVKENGKAALEAGVYLIDGEDKVYDYIALGDIKNNDVNFMFANEEKTAALGFHVVDIALDDIDLYNWSDIRINNNGKTSNTHEYVGDYNPNEMWLLGLSPDFDNKKEVLGANVQVLSFMEITKEVDEDGKTVYGTKTYEAKKDALKSSLMTYIDEQVDDTVTVIIPSNVHGGKRNATKKQIAFFSGYSPLPNNTLTGIIIDNIWTAPVE